MQRGAPPGPKGLPFVGCLREIQRSRRLAFLVETARDYGGVASFPLGRERIYFVSAPELVQQVLHDPAFEKDQRYKLFSLIFGDSIVSSEGETWLRHRRALQPAYSHRHLFALFDVFVQEAEQLAERWKPLADRGTPFELGGVMQDLVFRVSPRIGFSVDVDAGEAGTIARASHDVSSGMNRIAWSLVRLPFWVPSPANRRLWHAKRVIGGIIDRVLDRRLRDGDAPPDLLSLLMEARDAEGRGLERGELRDEMMAYLVNGHGATGSSLTSSFALLSGHPEVRRRVEQEVDAVTGGSLCVADLERLEYTRRVYREALRLYPSLYVWTRAPSRDFELGGFRIPKGARVMVSSYATHRQAAWWPDPERFDPDRHLAGAGERAPRYAYIPFGGGRRVCPGERFATLQALAVLATVCRRYRVDVAPGERFDPNPLLNLRPRVRVRVSHR
jgi:cytochrome P450